MTRTAIVGAGIAGLASADALRAAGREVTLFDKGRGAGGRMSTRRVATPQGEAAFDHGATHFTARSHEFRALVDHWHGEGHVAPWPVAGTDAWTGTPSMNAPVKALAAMHDVRWSSTVTALLRDAAGWHLYSEARQFGPYDAVALAMPAEQAAPLLSLHDFAMAREAMAVRSHAMWSAMFVFDRPIEAPSDFLRGQGAIAYAVRNSAKPGRSPIETWVVQANWHWSSEHLSEGRPVICARLFEALAETIGTTLPEPVFADAHRWLFAQPSGNDRQLLWNAEIGLGACGDWLSHGFVEYAWQSGKRLGEAMAASKRSGN